MNEMRKSIDVLKASPVFQMSLHAKELFHSNFLAWLGSDPELKDVFRNVMEAIGLSRKYIESWGDDFVIWREKHHFDLLVKAPDTKKVKKNGNVVSQNDGEVYLVIENKIKSVPNKAQLEKYTRELDKYRKATGFEKILLSIDSFDGPLPEGWKRATYAQVIKGLEKPLPEGISEYKKTLIMDYTEVLKALVGILSTIKVTPETKYLPDSKENELRIELDQLRILDLYDKWRASKIASLLTKELGLDVGFGYSNKSSFIQVDVALKEQMRGTIQIQTSQYRRCISDTCQQFAPVSERCEKFLFKTKGEFQEKVTQGNEGIFKAAKMQKDSCSYKDGTDRVFWYQYVTITSDATIRQIAECIKRDLKILEEFNK